MSIYKTYKHGGLLDEFPIGKVYRALKREGIQVVKVFNHKLRKFSLYVYCDDLYRFHKIR